MEPETTELTKMLVETFADERFRDLLDEWYVLFNPGEYVLARSNQYNAEPAPGTSKPQTAYAYGNPDQLTLSLFFDGTGAMGEPGPVMEGVSKVMNLMRFEGEQHRPPYLRLTWAELSFPCYLKSATATFGLFNREGEPIRAKVDCSFEEVIDEELRVNAERASSPDLLRTWLVRDGDSLDAIAHRVYGDAAHWRTLASANQLANPRALVPGDVLTLPPKDR